MDKHCRICHNTSCSNHGKNISFLGDGWKCNYIPVPTNADRIRAMSDEELADHNIHTVKVWNRYEGYHEIEYRCSDGYTTGIYDFALRHEMDWLKQPVKDGEGDDRQRKAD